jgi:hypothetical protein
MVKVRKIGPAFSALIPSFIFFIFVLSVSPAVVYCRVMTTNWTLEESWGTFEALAYGNGYYVGVGAANANGYIGTSSDGENWTYLHTDTDQYLIDILFANEKFVAVGGSGTIYTSSDGLLWTKASSPTIQDLNSIAYGPSTFVAVGAGGTILVSSDAATWDTRGSGTSEVLRDVGYSEDQFLAVGANGILLVSANGDNWEQRTMLTDDLLTASAYGNSINVVIGNNCTLLTSPDGTAWTGTTLPEDLQLCYDIEYGNGLFLIFGSPSYPIGTTLYNFLISPNGSDWSPAELPVNDGLINYLYGLSFLEGQFTLSGSVRGVVTSPDGVNWTTQTHGQNAPRIWDVVSGDHGYLAVGPDANLLTSPDGKDWELQPISRPGYFPWFNRAAFGNSVYVTSGLSSLGNLIYSSQDSMNWSTFQAFCGGQEKIVHTGAGFYFWGNSCTYFSETGIDWTLSNNISNPTDLAYGNSIYVATGSSGTIRTSPDTVTWTVEVSGTDKYLQSLLFAGGQFVAVGGSGTILTSTDGKDWTVRSTPTSHDLVDIVYATGAYFTAGRLTDTGVILTSEDGQSWVVEDLPFDSVFLGLAFRDNELVLLSTSGLHRADIVEGDSTQEGCFIATAAFGSEMESHVATLRRFRDEVLIDSATGRAFIEVYYKYSPSIANYISKRNTLKKLTRMGLVPVVAFAEMFLD